MAYAYTPGAGHPTPPPLPAYLSAVQQANEIGHGSVPITQAWAYVGTAYQLVVYPPVRLMIIDDPLVRNAKTYLVATTHQWPSFSIAYADQLASKADLFERVETALRNLAGAATWSQP